MRIFMSPNTPKIIETGGSVDEHPLWRTEAEIQGHRVLYLGAKINTWVLMANILHLAGPEGATIAEAIASEFGLESSEKK